MEARCQNRVVALVSWSAAGERKFLIPQDRVRPRGKDVGHDAVGGTLSFRQPDFSLLVLGATWYIGVGQKGGELYIVRGSGLV